MFYQASILNSNYAVQLDKYDELVGVEYDPETGEELGAFVPTVEWMKAHHPDLPSNLKPSKEWLEANNLD